MKSISFYLSFVLSIGLIPLTIYFCHQFRILDRPNERKIHTVSISRLGGIAIFFSICGSLLILSRFLDYSFDLGLWRIVVFGGFAAFFLGFLDDIKNIPAKVKLIFQLGIALLAYFLGFKISEIQIGFDHPLQLGHLSGFFTVLWIVTVMNAINMIDGLDGLAGGFAFLVFGTISALGYLNGNPTVMIFSLACAGACLGFLIFNFHPAKIFMGDAGSMTIGFVLSVLTVSTGQHSAPVSIFTPLFLLAFPLIDLLTAVLRRLIHAKTTEKNITVLSLVQKTFDADGNHIHHRLLKLGFSQSRIAMIIYFFTILNCLMGVASVYLSFSIVFFLFIFYVWFTVQSIRLLEYEEFVTSTFRNQIKKNEEKQKLSTAPKLVKRVT